MIKNTKGFTLLEVILTLALMGVVLMVSTNFFIFGNKVQNLSMADVDIQASTRLTSEYINNVTRFATKVHTIPRSSFQNTVDGVRDPNTSYLGITKEGHLVIDKPGVALGDPRTVQMIAKKQVGIDYEIIFNEVMYDKDRNPDNGEEAKLDTLLSFSVIGKKDGKKVAEIISNIEVLNALNIDHLGTSSDPAVALAFSMVEPGSQEWIEVSPDAYITMVLDTSGSMKWDMDGKSESITNANRRITILKENANKMIDRLANMDFNIYVSLVPFANDADDPKGFCNVNDATDLATIKAQIAALDANGATNTGDGIRRAYHQLKSKADTLITAGKTYNDFTQHMMVLVDGQTNRETRKITGRSWFFGYYVTSEISALEGGNTNNNVVVGNKRVVSVSENNNDYINILGTSLIQKTYTFEEEEKQIINTFVIGFSNQSADHGSLQAIGTALNGKMFEHVSGQKPYVLATNAGELDFAFEQFEAEVENSLWVITRPKLKP